MFRVNNSDLEKKNYKAMVLGATVKVSFDPGGCGRFGVWISA